MALHGQSLAELLHGVWVLVHGRQHAEGDFDAFGVVGVDHGWVHFCDGGEGRVGLGGKGDDLGGGRGISERFIWFEVPASQPGFLEMAG